MKRSLAIRTWLACGVAAVCLAGAGIPAGAAEIDANALRQVKVYEVMHEEPLTVTVFVAGSSTKR